MIDANRTAVVFIAVLVLLALAMPATVTAAVSVTRDLPDAVSPGVEFEVSVTQSGFYLTGSVTEKLPEGFKYMGVLSGGKLYKNGYDETTNELTIDFDGGATTLIYRVEAGTKEQIEKAVFSGTWATVDKDLKKIYGDIGGDTTLEFVEPTPTPTPAPTTTEAPPSNGGAGGGGPPPSPPVGKSAYIHLNATPAEIPADGISTSAITAFVWDGEEWVSENLTVNFSTSLGTITASALVVNESAIAILTAGTEEGIANVTAEANLSGDIGVVINTTTVNFTTPGVTPTPTATPEVTPVETPVETPMATPTATPSPTPTPGFEVIFAIAGLLSIAYLVLRQRRKKKV